ncbi:permease family-domain-containing protein [Amylocarpus encephaloides]|uniref:Permease family-domain-containing protein n=1 Tax=Amylocarpus encephaloides TaxID=45428 RepID=A0A9P8C6C4_9HELO|nr:permease family-domain-containing protein [Amylocarpus encephaloides]
MGWVERTNMAMAKSVIGRHFRLEFCGTRNERKGTRFLNEVRAGLATFFAMAYIISVNASITADSGGVCICDQTLNFTPPDPHCMNSTNPASSQYERCVQEINRDLVTGTAAVSALSSFSMGLFANMPIALAPGMGLNAYFTYQVVGFHGSGTISYRLALTAIFVEGLIFVLLSIFGLRQWLARVIPASLKIASGAGIGLYLALIGLTYDAGIGAITGGMDDPLRLGGCVPSSRGVDGICQSGKMRNPTMWLGIFGGGIFTAFLMMYRVKGAIIAGILLVSIISWPRDTPVTHFPRTALGDYQFDFFKKIVTFHPIKKVLAVQDWDIGGAQAGQFAVALVTFLYVDILDCTGTLYSMARFCGAIDEDTQDFEGSAVAYLVDALGITVGSLFGSPPVTAFIESGAGISEGGATGITACVTGLCFFFSLFFAPIFASIPSWATGCTLILVGAMMARACTDINWRYIGDSVPAFLTMAVMPFTYSIAYGLITGIVTYAILNTGAYVIGKISSGRIVPHDYEQKEYWTWKIRGGLVPGWLKRFCGGKRDFWREWDFDAEAEELESRDSYILRKKSVRSSRRMSGQNRPRGMSEGTAQVPMDGRVWDVNRLAGYGDGHGMGHFHGMRATEHEDDDDDDVAGHGNTEGLGAAVVIPDTGHDPTQDSTRLGAETPSGRGSWVGSVIGNARGSGIMILEGIRGVSGSVRR